MTIVFLQEYLAKKPDFPEHFVKVPRICVWMAERRKIHENIFFKKKNELTVDKMELLTQLDWLERPPMVEEIETIEEEDNTEPQVSEIKAHLNDAFLTFVDDS